MVEPLTYFFCTLTNVDCWYISLQWHMTYFIYPNISYLVILTSTMTMQNLSKRKKLGGGARGWLLMMAMMTTAKVPMTVIVIMLEIVLGGAGGWLLCC